MFGRWVVFGGLAGCGGLADGAYRGEPLLTLRGTVVTSSLDAAEADATVGVAVLWTLGPTEGDQARAVVVRTAFPAQYTLELYHPPAISGTIDVMGDFPGLVGVPIIFRDDDADGSWDAGDEAVLGGSYSTAVVYSDAIPGWFAGDLPQNGFLPVRPSDAPCADGEPPIAVNPQDSGASDLYVGYIWPALPDWDCDGSVSEWSGGQWSHDASCPSSEVVSEACGELADGLGRAQSAEDLARLAQTLEEDPFWTQCLAQECPEVIGQIGPVGRAARAARLPTGPRDVSHQGREVP